MDTTPEPDHPEPNHPDHHRLVTILPCTDLDTAEAFFGRLGFVLPPDLAGKYPDYRMLADGRGGEIHLQPAVKGWLVPGCNPFGVYLYTADVDRLAAVFRAEIIEAGKRATHKPWGMYEFALNGPDDVLVRIGWPSRLIRGD